MSATAIRAAEEKMRAAGQHDEAIANFRRAVERLVAGESGMLRSAELEPVSWPTDPALEWVPPGHGDVYGALRRSGMLRRLLEQGFEYAMISNSDNLGATVDPRIAAYLSGSGAPFLLEVVEGTKA